MKNFTLFNLKFYIFPIVSFMYFVVDLNTTQAINIDFMLMGPNITNGAAFETSRTLNTYDANGNPCTISQTPNCGLYMINIGVVMPIDTSISSATCANPQASSLCTFKPMTYNGTSFSRYASENNAFIPGNTEYNIGSTANAISTTMTYSISQNGITVSGGSTGHVIQGPTSNIVSVDSSNFDGSRIGDNMMMPIISTSTGGRFAVSPSIFGVSSTTSTTTSSNTNTSTTNTSTTPSTQQQTPQRAKKICVMRMKLFNVVP
jgi:hypothetical protein